MNDSYDVIVIGAGAGGGVAACVLAEAGRRVLLLERGHSMNYADVSRDHLRNHRLARYGFNTGPDLQGNPRVSVDPSGDVSVVDPVDARWQNNAMVVGGGTRVYGAQAWRFLPTDFRMASTYGVPANSSMADWPISYDDLAPYYERAEWELGVSGDHERARRIWSRNRPYPMPPVPENQSRRLLDRAAKELGWDTMPVPLLINTTEYNGRRPCVQCGNCVGFACPSDGKTGTQNTVIPRAIKTGLCDLLTESHAERIDTDDYGQVIGVTYFTRHNGTIERCSARAKQVIVSCAAIETARLLLNSTSSHHPAGLGNEHDQVGRHLQGHVYVGAQGVFPERLYDGLGPGVSTCTLKFNHGNPGVIGGGLLANEFIKMPIHYWYSSWPPEVSRWGLEAKRFMRDSYVRAAHIQGPVHEIPNPESRVSVDPTVRDRYGIPVARFSGQIHPATLDSAEFMRQRAVQWLDAAGASRSWSWKPGMRLSGGQHQAGTCRMGDDPKASVTDRWGRVHGHDNLFIADGSLHVTNGGFNPVLTILALAYRVAEGAIGAME